MRPEARALRVQRLDRGDVLLAPRPLPLTGPAAGGLGSLHASVVVLAPGLEALAEIAQEAPGQRAVDQTVVVRERQVHDRPDRDRVVAELVLDDPRPLHECVRA